MEFKYFLDKTIDFFCEFWTSVIIFCYLQSNHVAITISEVNILISKNKSDSLIAKIHVCVVDTEMKMYLLYWVQT